MAPDRDVINPDSAFFVLFGNDKFAATTPEEVLSGTKVTQNEVGHGATELQERLRKRRNLFLGG